MGILSLLENLTSDERIDNVVQESCKANIGEWDKHWTGASTLGKKCGLVYYVPSKFSIAKPLVENETEENSPEIGAELPASRRGKSEGYAQIEGAYEEEWLLKLLQQGGDRLCVWQGPGAGKTILTRRLLAFLSTPLAQRELFGGRPALVIRREEAKLDGAWPSEKELFDDLIQELRKTNPKKKQVELKTIINSLLLEGRVALVLDALDQSAPKRVQGFKRLLSLIHKRSWRCRIVVTSRPYAVPRIASEEVNWKLARLDPFDRRQQYQYLLGPGSPNPSAVDAFSKRTIEPNVEIYSVVDPAASEWEMNERLSALIPSHSDDDPLTANPQNLFYIRELAKGAKGRRRKVRFRNRADLYLQVTRRMWLREVKNREGRPSGRRLNAATWPEFERILSAIAFAMMTNRPEKESIKGAVQVEKLKERADKAYGKPIPKAAWSIALSSAEFTNRSLLANGSELLLAWPDRRMMEFHCGLYLAANKRPGWAKRSKTLLASLGCGDPKASKWAARDEWRETWIHAIELGDLASQTSQDEIALPKTLAASLSPLFEPVATKSKVLRPTELMYRAYALFSSSKSKVLRLEGQRILSSFQQQFIQILEDGQFAQAKIAAQLVPEFILRERIKAESRLAKLLPSTAAEESFVRCPPSGNTGVFWMGTHSSHVQDIYDDERPRHPIQLASFWMQATSVTVEQFLLFDPVFAKCEKNAKYFESHAPAPDCPVIMTNYFDATMFALWTGNSLPTEAQREFAARAGCDRIGELFGIAGNLRGRFDQITSQVANFDGSCPYPAVEVKRKSVDTKWVWPESTLPVRWTADRRGSFALDERKKPPPFAPNRWRLWQMQGNVWEWCSTIFEDDAYLKRANAVIPTLKDDSMPGIETAVSKLALSDLVVLDERYIFSDDANRVLRGGGWCSDGHNCRAGSRHVNSPEARYVDVGFRLSHCFPPSRCP